MLLVAFVGSGLFVLQFTMYFHLHLMPDPAVAVTRSDAQVIQLFEAVANCQCAGLCEKRLRSKNVLH